MEAIQKPRVKICCIGSIEEAHLAVKLGASAVGLVSAMPSGPGPIPEELIAEIAASVPPGVATFLLTCKQSADEVIDQQRRSNVNTLQLVDQFPIREYDVLRRELPGIRIVQVVHVRDKNSLEEAVAIAPRVDALLLDSGNPSLAVKELGGTGRVHDWNVSRQIRESVNVPVFLAGGLKPENVQEAIRRVQPFALDVCSGVRTNGNLDEKKLRAFFGAIS
ncbi:MAG TPA: phosphoribosylanthranilate isomerase [Bacteroidota bacterium]|jgi:phosphoribosylanthranilate isomerase|nr:phosphoribosylanthranilate isomerase [Bacteroidota bacterium]